MRAQATTMNLLFSIQCRRGGERSRALAARFVLVLGGAACGPAAAAAAVEAPVTAPALALARGGGTLSLQAYRGQVVYLDFWASWCGPCKQSFPFMNAMQRKYADAGLRVVAVNVDQNVADAQGFLRLVPAEFTVALDPGGVWPRQFAIKGMPSNVLIGRDGRTVSTHQGFKKSDEAKLERAIIHALGRGA